MWEYKNVIEFEWLRNRRTAMKSERSLPSDLLKSFHDRVVDHESDGDVKTDTTEPRYGTLVEPER